MALESGQAMVRPTQLIRQSSLFTLWHSVRGLASHLPALSSIPTILQTLGTGPLPSRSIPSLHTMAELCVLCPPPSDVTLGVKHPPTPLEPAAFMDSLNQSILEAAFVWSSFWQQTPRLTPLCEGRELESGAVSWRRTQQIFLPAAILVNKSQKSSHEGMTRGRNFPDSICKLNNVYNLTDQASRRGLNFPSPRS